MSALARAQIPLWREGRVVLERRALLRDRVLAGDGVPRGHGEPVLLIAGFLAGDPSLGVMARWLRELGYRPVRAGLRVNVDCAAETVKRLEAQLEAAVERYGGPAWVVGHSRGGTMARVLAVRRPELVRGIVTLGSPLRDQFDIHPLIRAQVRTVAALGSLGIPGLFSNRCREGCCAEVNEQLDGPFPSGVAFTSVYSRSDGVVGWRSCLDSAADAVEVDASHCGMAVNAGVFRAVGAALGGVAVPQPATAAA